jgi:hypothetical protein
MTDQNREWLIFLSAIFEWVIHHARWWMALPYILVVWNGWQKSRMADILVSHSWVGDDHPMWWITFVCVYIYMLFITLGDGPMVPSSGPASQLIGLFNLCATELSRMLLTLCAPRWPRAPGPSRALIEPTQPCTLNHFRGSLSHFDKLSAISNFLVLISHFATLLLQCWIILATVLSHSCYTDRLFYWTQSFLVSTVLNYFHRDIVLNHFPLSYSAQPF